MQGHANNLSAISTKGWERIPNMALVLRYFKNRLEDWTFFWKNWDMFLKEEYCTMQRNLDLLHQCFNIDSFDFFCFIFWIDSQFCTVSWSLLCSSNHNGTLCWIVPITIQDLSWEWALVWRPSSSHKQLLPLPTITWTSHLRTNNPNRTMVNCHFKHLIKIF